ncbi:hypothetical protein [Prochlorococcus sp. MIT 1307]|uniref:hypothetical protein n=1 Tax=Prochlorococcus sp. MIT 1307 TaxID=3096219 RepID=UPI002A75EF91|nr:hypothetical protein [Prochlorococcus sp. MIT 1307]
MHKFFKKVASNLIPPGVFKLYQFLASGKSRYTYKGIFNTFEEAKNASGQDSPYLNKDFDKAAVDETYSVLSKLNLYGRSDQRKGLLLEMILKLRYPHRKATILDYGGGNYPQYAYLSREIQDITNTIIIDRKDLIQLIRQDSRFSKLPANLKFLDLNEFEAAKLNIDIVYFGSTVQYISDLISNIGSLSQKGCQYVIICDSTFTEKDHDIYVLQQNEPPSVFPNKWHSRKDLIQNMNKIGYDLILENRRRHNYKHDSIRPEDFFYQTFIFERCKTDNV